ncbi:nickel-responsive transcriptional regulator NikR [Serpentinimonas maccroryi]|uniref:nickel-responsive transcriptional regulator NikR n=1 Tax=Serpentinimonas maccroryi TaxID=1458426 RepID=UPI002033D129|nr:nickel-responsive transcriptional regulator NikR [Serpentinimonas maccroryi]MCM2478454.1 nickel-responsive transcriptional regulator NikR [Serpentinimonas maccroryi]
MKRLTMSLDDDLADAFDALVLERGYANRSEAFRDLLRHDLGAARLREHPEQPCVAVMSYVYDHHRRQLSTRLTDLQHAHHEYTVATLHAHLDHQRADERARLAHHAASLGHGARGAQRAVLWFYVRHDARLCAGAECAVFV